MIHRREIPPAAMNTDLKKKVKTSQYTTLHPRTHLGRSRPPNALSTWDPPSEIQFWVQSGGSPRGLLHRRATTCCEVDTATTVGHAVIWSHQKSGPWSRSSKKLKQQWHFEFPRGASITWSSLQVHQGDWEVWPMSQGSEMMGEYCRPGCPWALAIMVTPSLPENFSGLWISLNLFLVLVNACSLADSSHKSVSKQASLSHLRLTPGIKGHFLWAQEFPFWNAKW